MKGSLKLLSLALLFVVTPSCLPAMRMIPSLVQAQTVEQRKAQADQLLQQGAQYLDSGEYQAALEAFQRAFTIYEEISDDKLIAAAIGIGYAYAYLGETNKATEIFQATFEIAQQYNLPELLKLAELGLQLAQNQSNSPQTQNNPPQGQAERLFNEGMQLFQQGTAESLQLAINLWKEALILSQQEENKSSEALINMALGRVHDLLGFKQEALNYYNQALPLYQEIGAAEGTRSAHSGEAGTLNNIGAVYDSIGQPEEALKFFNQALPILQEVGDRSGEATTLNNIGGVYLSIGQPEEALKFYNQALPILQEVGDRRGEATILSNIGLVYDSIGQPEEALKFFNQALPILQEVGDRRGEAATLNNIGAVYQGIGQPEEALKFFNQALPILQEVGDRTGEATTFNNIGLVYDSIGQPEEALKFFNQALPILQEVGDRTGEATTFNNIGAVYQGIGQPEEALKFFNQALPIMREVGDRSGEAATLSNIGFLHESQGNAQQAISFYQQSIDVTESIQGEIKVEELKASFASQQINEYARLINLLWEKGDYKSAFNYAERAKARTFLDQFANGRVNIRRGAEPKLLEREQTLKGEITALSKSLIELRNRPKNQWDTSTIEELEARRDARQKDYQDLLTQLKLQSPEVAALKTVDVASLSEIQSLLDPDTTLIEYFVTEERTLAFIITRNSFNTVSLNNASPAAIQQQLDLFLDFPNPYPDDSHPPQLQQLHQWLIKPLQPYLQTPKLAIVPHSLLHYLPWAALTDGNGYLSEEYILSTLPSASILRFLPDKRKTDSKSLLALGNPVTPDLPPLRHAQAEVEGIAPLFNATPLIRERATESALKTGVEAAGIVHLAAHGEYNPINALFSTIHLTEDSRNDGKFQVHEIYNDLDLNQATNLVVLSACDTNKGQLSGGDDIVGLNRALLFAGTPTVIASLWNVDDAATGILMKQFYSYLQEDMDKAKALQKAQSWLRQEHPEYAHPYFWSAFSLTGAQD